VATEKQLDRMWDILIDLDSETLLRAITNYHGMRVLDEDFAEFLVGEGLLDSEVVGREDEEEDDEEN
jgi:hypothetical protein